MVVVDECHAVRIDRVIALAVVRNLSDFIGIGVGLSLARVRVLGHELGQTRQPLEHSTFFWHLLIAADGTQRLAVRESIADG